MTVRTCIADRPTVDVDGRRTRVIELEPLAAAITNSTRVLNDFVNHDLGRRRAAILESYGSSFSLANGDDELILENAMLTEIDRVEWDGGPTFPDPSGA